MHKTRLIIKLLRRFSLIMIALPEPITTALGAVLLFFTFYLARAFSRIIENSLNLVAKERLTNYLAHYKRLGNSVGNEVEVLVRAERHREILRRQLEQDLSLQAEPHQSLWQSFRDRRRDVLQHNIDMRSLILRYGTGNSFPVKLAESGRMTSVRAGKELTFGETARDFFAVDSWGSGSGCSSRSRATETMISHTINRKHLFRRYNCQEKVVPVSQPVAGHVPEKLVILKNAKIRLYSQPGEHHYAAVVYHAVNMASLQRRFSSEGRQCLDLKVHREGFIRLGAAGFALNGA